MLRCRVVRTNIHRPKKEISEGASALLRKAASCGRLPVKYRHGQVPSVDSVCYFDLGFYCQSTNVNYLQLRCDESGPFVVVVR